MSRYPVAVLCGEQLGPIFGSPHLVRIHDRSAGIRACGRARDQPGGSEGHLGRLRLVAGDSHPWSGRHVHGRPPRGGHRPEYDWDLNGDGTTDQRGKTATWSYAVPGPVSVRLAGKGNGNRRGEAIHIVSVQAAGAAVSPRGHRTHPSRSHRPRRSPISRCCLRPLPATRTAGSPRRSGISTATATTTTVAARRHFARSPRAGTTWSGCG